MLDTAQVGPAPQQTTAGRAGPQRAGTAGRRAGRRRRAARHRSRASTATARRAAGRGSIRASCCAAPTWSRPSTRCAPPMPRSARRAPSFFPRISADRRWPGSPAARWARCSPAARSTGQAGAVGHAADLRARRQRAAISTFARRSATPRSRRTRRRSRPRSAKSPTRSRGAARSPTSSPRRQDLVAAAARHQYVLDDARYREGIDPFLNSLDAQRTLYTARRTLAATRLTRGRQPRRRCTARWAAMNSIRQQPLLIMRQLRRRCHENKSPVHARGGLEGVQYKSKHNPLGLSLLKDRRTVPSILRKLRTSGSGGGSC